MQRCAFRHEAGLVVLFLLPVVACAPEARPDLDERASHGRTGATALTPARWEAPRRGGAGERAFSVACEPGWVAVGIHGRAGDHIDRVGLVCQHLGAGGRLVGEDFRGTHGGETGQSFLRMCPAGYAIGGLGGRTGAHVVELQIVCDTLPGAVLFYSSSAGGPDGSPFTDIAPNGYFLTELSGHSGDRVDGFSAVYNKVNL